jgi:pyruvate-formate lyase-activating enzyme
MLSESKSQFLDSLKMDDYESVEELAEAVKKEGISPYDCLGYVTKGLKKKSLEGIEKTLNTYKRSNNNLFTEIS